MSSCNTMGAHSIRNLNDVCVGHYEIKPLYTWLLWRKTKIKVLYNGMLETRLMCLYKAFEMNVINASIKYYSILELSSNSLWFTLEFSSNSLVKSWLFCLQTIAHLSMRSAWNTMGSKGTPRLAAPLVRGPKWSYGGWGPWALGTPPIHED